MSLTQTQIDRINSLTLAIGGLVSVPGAKPQVDALLKQISEITGTPVFSGEMVEAIKQATEAGGTETPAADPANGCEAGCDCPDIRVAIISKVPPCIETAFAGISAIAQSHGMPEGDQPLVWLANYLAAKSGVAADIALLAHMSNNGLEPLKGLPENPESHGLYLKYVESQRAYFKAKTNANEAQGKSQSLSVLKDRLFKDAKEAQGQLSEQIDKELEAELKSNGTIGRE